MRQLRSFINPSRFQSFIRALGVGVTAAIVLLAAADIQAAGSIFITGHDPDFHARLGGNTAGAIRINQVAIAFVQDSNFNPFVGTAPKFLFVESRIAPPAGHTVGKNGILDSGYVEGVHFEHHDASTLNAELNLLGVKYSAIVVASDFGGILTQAELDILNARQVSIVTFVNAGGGVYAMAESNSGANLTPNGGRFAFLPIVVAAPQLDQNEIGFTVSPFGASLGLTNADINGNASHNYFTTYGTLQPVDLDASGHVMTVAGREELIAVEPTTWGRTKVLYR